jgi:hypothetical protein
MFEVINYLPKLWSWETVGKVVYKMDYKEEREHSAEEHVDLTSGIILCTGELDACDYIPLTISKNRPPSLCPISVTAVWAVKQKIEFVNFTVYIYIYIYHN